MHMGMLDRDLLLARAALLVERIQQYRPGTREPVRLIEVLPPPLESLLVNHCVAVAFHLGVVGGERGPQLAVSLFIIRVVQPQRLQGLIGDGGVPVIGLRTADVLQRALSVFPIVGTDGRRCLSLGKFSLRHNRSTVTAACVKSSGKSAVTVPLNAGRP